MSSALERESRVRLLAGDCLGGWELLTRAFRDDPEGMSYYGEGVVETSNAYRIGEGPMIAALSSALRRRPRLAAALAWRGALRRRQCRYEEAAADLARAERLGLRTAAVLTWLGEARLQLADIDEGFRLLRSALTKRDARAWNWAWCGRSYLTRARDAAGLDYLDRAVVLAPDWPVALAWRGEARRRLGDKKGMEADFSAALRLAPDAHLARLIRGWRALARGGAGALRDLREAAVAMPDYPLWHRGLAQAAWRAGDDSAWIESFDRAARLSAKYVHEAGCWDARFSASALAALDRVCSARPRHAAARAWRGFLRLRAGMPARALRDLEAACSLDPAHPAAWAWRAQALAEAGKPAEARRALTRGLALSPRVDLWLALSRLELGQGRLQPALKAYASALAADPGCARAYTERGALQLALGDAAGAAADLRRAVDLDRRDANAAADLAEALSRLGRRAQAGELRRRALRLDSAAARHRFDYWRRSGPAQTSK
jgi:tetratricopeptide (TPR) repeat protein